MNLFDLLLAKKLAEQSGSGGGGIQPILHLRMIFGGFVWGEQSPAMAYEIRNYVKDNAVHQRYSEEKTIAKDEFVDVDTLVFADNDDSYHYEPENFEFFFGNTVYTGVSQFTVSNMVNCEYDSNNALIDITDPTKEASATITLMYEHTTDPLG